MNRESQAGFGCIIVLLFMLLLAGLIAMLAFEYSEEVPDSGQHDKQSALNVRAFEA